MVTPDPAVSIALESMLMSQPSTAHAGTRTAEEIVRDAAVGQAPNGVCYATAGETAISGADIDRLVATVPTNIAAALKRKAYYFVPLTIGEDSQTLVAERYDVALSDRAICHRNVTMGTSQCVFISTRLMDDKFSVAFEFFINVGHAFVEEAGVSQAFSDLVWKQVEGGVKGETSLDAHDFRKQAIAKSTENGSHLKVVDEKAKTSYLNTAFSDAIAIYMLSLYLDVDYWDLREREYPLLTPAALAERVRKVADLFPANPGFDFAVYYRRRG
jgi:hypothetical protein